MTKKMSGISKKSKMIAATAFVLGLTALGGGIASVSAAETVNARNSMSALVSAISSKFDLDPTDVQTVVDEVMEAQRAGMKEKSQVDFDSRLEQAVTDGELTQVQADLILSKSAELKASMKDDLGGDENMTREERKEKMEERSESLKEWADNNDIPEEYLRFVGGRGKGFGGHGGPRPEKIR